ncbi:MAG: hypothetical protein F2MM_05125 [Candidatus Midichloria mitochondrii]
MPTGGGALLKVNQHNPSDIANSILSLNQLSQILPDIKWAAPVVGWFANSLEIAECAILPGVEFKGNGTTTPD